MADKKISELNAITGINTADDDLFVIVDTSAGETKKILKSELVATINAALIDGAPETLDTLNELAAALADDANFASTVTSSLAGKVSSTGDTMTGNLNFGDNDKAVFGAGSDLQIYHDGSHSYVSDQGTGNLNLKGTNLNLQNASGVDYLRCTSGGDIEIYHNGGLALNTTSTGIDVTGTATMDGLTVDGTIFSSSTVRANVGTASTPNFTVDGGAGMYKPTSNVVGFSTSSTQRMRLADNGDISFYEDTGTTPKFFWDASAERLGIGTSSPDRNLHIAGNAAYVKFDDTLSGDTFTIGSNSNGFIVYDDDAALYRMVIDSSGNVGIGTSSPSAKLQIQKGSNGEYLRVGGDETSDGNRGLRFTASSSASFTGAVHDINAPSSQGAITLSTSSTERMRIDSSGNVFVGKTVADTTTSGGRIRPSGRIDLAVSNDKTISANRLGSDGSIIDFYKDGSTVGSIGTIGELYIQGLNRSGLWFATNVVRPFKNGSGIDNAMDFGSSTYRWDDIYATNGTIQTSDEREKQDIAELSEAEQRVAVACKGLLRKFRWKDAVAEKGDDARIHFGIIAQDLKAAFEAEGLDAGDYAMFIHTTWWEHSVEVPAVEAQEAVYETQVDEEGNEVQVLVSEAVEGKEAYTRTDTYDTAEEAPEGAVERDRMGVRYPELLAFIIASI